MELDTLIDSANLYSICNGEITHKKIARDNKINEYKFDEDIVASSYDIFLVEPSRNDSEILVKNGVYEGGFTVWESSWNFLKFLESSLENANRGSTVLDLGSGTGFLGLLAYLKGYSVCFQDMNHEVLEKLTFKNFVLTFWFNRLKKNGVKPLRNISSISLECDIETGLSVSTVDIANLVGSLVSSNWLDGKSSVDIKNTVGFTCSTWDKLAEEGDNVAFDYILSSETLYRTREYPNLVKILERFLNNDGISYFATKRLYFGIGGGSYEFIDYIHNNSKALKANVVHSVKEDRSVNIIDIIKITKIT